MAREDLHPALSDLLISAAREIHGGPGLFATPGEYPAPLARDFPISADAERYYKSGEQFLYKRLPFWLASLVDRLLVVLLPLLVVIVPATPHRAGDLSLAGPVAHLPLVRRADGDRARHARGRRPSRRRGVHARLDEIARAVNELRTPPSFGDQLYVLRDHVAGVRRRLETTLAGRQ